MPFVTIFSKEPISLSLLMSTTAAADDSLTKVSVPVPEIISPDSSTVEQALKLVKATVLNNKPNTAFYFFHVFSFLFFLDFYYPSILIDSIANHQSLKVTFFIRYL